MKCLARALSAMLPWVMVVPAMLVVPRSGTGQGAAAAGGGAARIIAVRADRIPRVDGRLDEPAWQQAQFARDFVQREPHEGEAATQQTEVAFVYTEDALYVGARLSEAAGAVRALVTRRDREETSDRLVISLDTYRDRRTAYTFAVTAAGVRIDYYHPSDFETAREYGYDPVWEAETQVDSAGWTAEIRIPFSQLRFNAASEQVWGVNVVRITPARNELAYWRLVGRNETGWASRMGELVGLNGVQPSRRVEVLPYVASDLRAVSNVDRANPFAEARTTNWRAGGDLKLGVGPNFTIDATFNPDFGQVEADPAEVNLTAFETFFSERRPFFLEGTQLLNARGNFYSRRIGAPPLVPNAQYSKAIDHTSILGAAKITGRTARGFSVAALTALTAREETSTFDAGTPGRVEVAPLTSYTVAAVQKEFGVPARTSAVGYGLVTFVERDLEPESFLANAVARRAHTGILDYRIRWLGGQYDMSAFLGWSSLQGDTSALLAQQVSARRYYQRPDADYVELNPRATSLTGTYLGINHSKLSGKHWLWNIDYIQEAPGFELNDVGRLGGADDRGVYANLIYRENTPRGLLRSYEVGVGEVAEWNFGGERLFTILQFFSGTQLANYWNANFWVDYGLRAYSDNLTRGGPSVGTPTGISLGGGLSNRSGSRTRWSLGMSGSRNEQEGWSLGGNVSLATRPATQWEVSIDPRMSRSVTSRQYISTRSGGRAETFGQRYIFSYVERSEMAARIRLNYALTPELTLETYAEPFASSGRFYDFGELQEPREQALLTYGTQGTTITQPDTAGRRTVTAGGASFAINNSDFNVRSFRSNMVARWEWRPGSTLFLVWQQDRGSRESVGHRVAAGDVFEGLRADGDNFFALKINYWLPLR
jgi:uncharacterized protein DUF5916/cellulose/xylan binding protein with CBM9 domain